MERLVALGAALAFVSVCHTSAPNVGTVVVDDGRIGIGLITGGSFGPGSFSIGAHGSGPPAKIPVFMKTDNYDGEHIIIQKPIHHKGQQDNNQPDNWGNDDDKINTGGGIRGNAQLNPEKPLPIHTFSAHDGKRGEGSGGGQILIGAVVLPNKENNNGNKWEKYNRKPVATGASALEAMFASNGGNNGYPNKKHDSNDEQESILIGAITGGHFEQGALSLNNKRRPVANVPQKSSTVENENTGYHNTGNKAHYPIGHGPNNNGAGNTRNAYNHGQIKPGYNSGSYEEPWIWS